MNYQLKVIESSGNNIDDYMGEGSNGYTYFLFSINGYLIHCEVDFTEYGYEYPTLVYFESDEVVKGQGIIDTVVNYLNDLSVDAMAYAREMAKERECKSDAWYYGRNGIHAQLFY